MPDNQLELFERSYQACQKPIEDVCAEVREAIRAKLEEMGFIISLTKREGASDEKIITYFDIDQMVSFEQIRNGIIRNESDAKRKIEIKKSQCRIIEELSVKHGLSYTTIQNIRWGVR